MKFWDDRLRFCPKCRKSVELHGEEKSKCPHCGTRVWFFNYKPIPEPSPVPAPPDESLWKNRTTILILGAAALLTLAVLVAVNNGVVSTAASALAAIGFLIFAFIRQREAFQYERQLQHTHEVHEYGQIQHDRVTELTSRYQGLLRTGDARIEHYYQEIYVQAEREREQARIDRQAVAKVEQWIHAIAERYVNDHRKWSTQKLRADPENYQRRKNELTKAFDFVKSVGYDAPYSIRKEALDTLKDAYKQKVKEQALKDEQREIKRQLQEEARIERERQQAIKEAEDKERDLQARLQEALAQQMDEHSAEIEELQRQLAEAQASSERAKSMAQLTKAGHVYILSNIGSFGDKIFKVGMTRRLDPQDRVKELGDASVPFPFDVHAMIQCDNAPTLEKALHHELTRYRVNRVNLRKEYFEVALDTILAAVQKHHGRIEYVADPEALEYRETQTISPDELVQLQDELAEMGVFFEEADDE